MAHIRFENVALSYPLRKHRGMSLKEFLVRRFRREKVQLMEHVHALEDISFQCSEGERLGVIGCNGAGKSTLLRVIAGVYPVSVGVREVTGTICSMFDLSLGFEMEATGEENIYNRLYLQGETPRSIKSKVAPIIDFCDLGEFITLPIRTYSAGMLMRLAFAITTCNDPEILLIDEVFSSGDLSFQQKAQSRMEELISRARIVVMVGHDLPLIEQFCTRALWIDHGRVRMEGPPRLVVTAYRETAANKAAAAA